MTRWLTLVAALVAITFIPAFAHGDPMRAPGSIVAVDFGFENPADGTPLVTINPGETVTFSYPEGSSFHNVRFTKEQPTSCTQTAGGGSGPVPPLPAALSPYGWSGPCTFNAEGTYEFVCGAHPTMIGAVLAVPVNPTPTPRVTATATASASPAATATSTPTPAPTATVSPIATVAPQPTTAPTGGGETTTSTTLGPAASRLQVTRTQRGPAVKGSVAVARTGSRLRVEVLAKRKRVGSTTRSVDAGTASFTIRLNACAKRTLQRSRRLSVTLRITVTPPTGAAFTATRTVTLRR